MRNIHCEFPSFQNLLFLHISFFFIKKITSPRQKLHCQISLCSLVTLWPHGHVAVLLFCQSWGQNCTHLWPWLLGQIFLVNSEIRFHTQLLKMRLILPRLTCHYSKWRSQGLLYKLFSYKMQMLFARWLPPDQKKKSFLQFRPFVLIEDWL